MHGLLEYGNMHALVCLFYVRPTPTRDQSIRPATSSEPTRRDQLYFSHQASHSEALSEPFEPSSEPCRVALMIAAKNGAMMTATATATMTIGRKARGPGNFIDTDQITSYVSDQILCLRISTLHISALNKVFVIMFLHTILYMIILQMTFLHVYHFKDVMRFSPQRLPE